MKRAFAVLLAGAFALVSCATTTNSIYQSVAPEARGERAISSAIELVSEVDMTTAILGVFFSKEIYRDGEAQNVLFTLRGKSFSSGKLQGRITDYSLSETSSLSVDQARMFLEAIEQYLTKDMSSLAAAQMFNFELYSGTLDMSAGYEGYRPFQELTFMAICSVTNSGKSFKTVFPYTLTSITGTRSTGYQAFDLTTAQVEKLRDAITEALAMSTPVIKPLPAVKPGS